MFFRLRRAFSEHDWRLGSDQAKWLILLLKRHKKGVFLGLKDTFSWQNMAF